MRRIHLTKQERDIENALVKGEHKDVSPSEFEAISEALNARRKDAVLNIRVNSRDLKSIKQKRRN